MTSISQERAALAKLGQSLRLRSQWGAVRSYTDDRPVSEPAVRVFCHISVTNPGSYRDNDAHARAIEQVGISRFPATGISYNRGIMMDGTRYEFQPIGRRGAHTGSYSGVCTSSGCPNRAKDVSSPNHNVTARGYVICQNVGDAVSAKQLDALARTIAADQLAGFVRKGAAIHGHRCVSDKSCPGDKLWAVIGSLNNLVARYVRDGFGAEEDDLPTPADVWNHVIAFDTKAGTMLSQARTYSQLARGYSQDALAEVRALTKLVVADASNDINQEDLDAAKAEILAAIEADEPPTP